MVLKLQSGREYVVKWQFFNVQTAITPKECNPELRFLRSARRLMVLNICVKFHENILKVSSCSANFIPILLNYFLNYQ